MIITRTITKEVTRCSECPYYKSYGGHEFMEFCDAIPKPIIKDENHFYNEVRGNEISKKCPFLKK